MIKKFAAAFLLTLLALTSQAAPLATDTFTRADSATLGTTSGGQTWTETFNGALEVFTNAAAVDPGSTDSGARISSVTWPNDQYAQVTVSLGTGTVGGSGGGVMLRCAGSNTGIIVIIENSGTTLTIARLNAGSFNQISSQSVTFANGDLLYAQIVGQDISMKKNGAAFGTPVTDSTGFGGSLLTAGEAGVFGFDNVTLDSFEAGDLGGGAASPVPKILQQLAANNDQLDEPRLASTSR